MTEINADTAEQDPGQGDAAVGAAPAHHAAGPGQHAAPPGQHPASPAHHAAGPAHHHVGRLEVGGRDQSVGHQRPADDAAHSAQVRVTTQLRIGRCRVLHG